MRYSDLFRIKPGKKLKLRSVDPAFNGRHESEQDAAVEIEHYRHKIEKLQFLLYAEKKRSLLIVLQAPDAGGKDGTISHVFGALNPQGARVAGFKQPTAEELAHDFLWRVHPHAPAKGEVAIFNRSHYEDVLITRVHGMIDKATCEARYRRIQQFETLLAENGTTILKFYLHISPQEQLARFADRLNDPQRNWKISEADYTEREYGDDYVAAFEDAITATSTKHAPWFVIPANHKWFRNLAISQIVVNTLEDLHMSYPKPTVDLDDIRRKYHEAEREEKAGRRAGKRAIVKKKRAG